MPQSTVTSLPPAEADILPPLAVRQAQIAVWRPSNGTWYIRRNSDGQTVTTPFGQQGDIPVPGDYDGDGRTDLAVWRPSSGTWYIRRSADGQDIVTPFGQQGDIPVPADYDGDGRTDIAMVRRGPQEYPNNLVWYIVRSGGPVNRFYGFPLGAKDDIPVPVDYDGDGRADVVMWRPGTPPPTAPATDISHFYSQMAGPEPPFGLNDIVLGMPGDIPVPADYDGDGRADLAVWRPSDGTWRIRYSATGKMEQVPFGQQGDIPVPADYDGDGRTDIAVWRPSNATWYVRRSSDGQIVTTQFGQSGDMPVPAAYLGEVITFRQHVEETERRRATAVQVLRQSYEVPAGRTPDEAKFPRFAASFHKLLPHEAQTGLLTTAVEGNDKRPGVANYEQLLQGLNPTERIDFDNQALHDLDLRDRGPRQRVLINPRASKALSIKGPDITSVRASRLLYGQEDELRLLNEISLSSDYSAAEIVEVYAMALLRSPQLGSYRGQPDADLAVAALNSFGQSFVWGYDANCQPINASNRPVTPDNLFRGATAGDLKGDYLSVFLTFLRPPQFPSGCSSMVADLINAGAYAPLLSEPLLVPIGIDQDFMTTWADYVAVQNSMIPKPYPSPPVGNQTGFFRGRGPIQTGRDLGNYVHVDNVYEEYIRAADVLSGNQYNYSPNSPYTPRPDSADPYHDYPNEGNGPTLGSPDAYALISGVREVAERAAFTQKWLVARRARPEVMAALIHLARNGNTDLSKVLSPRLQQGTGDPVSRLLERVRDFNQSRNGPGGEANFLLAQMYPEGSPAHPAWPSGHATVGGACVTVLKAIFDDTQPIPKPNQPLAKDSSSLQLLTAADGTLLTVGGELDKLASNIAFGRNFGGVHFRTDGEHGIRIGEEVAIRYLQDHAREYRERFRTCRGFTLTKRNGQRVCITPEGVVVIDAPAPKQQATIFQKSLL